MLDDVDKLARIPYAAGLARADELRRQRSG
jgi:hypothetical protein